MPQISIIIPVYNAQKTLEKCLASVFSQTFRSFEVIAVNDGSTDNSLKILQKYQRQITIVNQPNQGAGGARNAGAKISRGQFLIFCDADIVMTPKMLEIMTKALRKKQGASYVYSSFKFGRKTFKLWPFDPKRLKTMPYIHTTSLIRQKHFPGFDKKLKRFQDWDLWLTMLKRGHKGLFINQVLFTVKPGGTMSNWLPSVAYKLPWLKKVRQYKEAEKIIKEKHNL
ncbi:MAG: glycosyltransferase family A protein [Patescibacteria group bacterium]|jgi:glycosyltransferase involved in cell wall biosynthesis